MLFQILQHLQGSLDASTVVRGAFAPVLLLLVALAVVIRNGNIYTTRRQLRHLRNVGLPTSTSNMADQYDVRYDTPEGAAIDAPIRVKAIYIHPVKSCGPVEVNRALLTKTGFMYDRCFALATGPNKTGADTDADTEWRFISQRTKPSMSLIKTELWLPHEESDPHDPLVQTGGCVLITFPDPDVPTWTSRLEAVFHSWSASAKPEVSFIAPLEPTAAEVDGSKMDLKTFTIHYRDARGVDMAKIPSVAAALPKLKRFLRVPESQDLTLLKCTTETLSRTDKNLAPLEHIGSPAVHGYTDQQPVHINNLASIHAVSALLPPENQPLNGLRFRANMWITGPPAFSEETWKRYRILPRSRGSRPRARVAPGLSVVCRTSRCTIPNVDPGKGTFDADVPPPDRKKGKPQPSTTLVQKRTVETGNKAALGYMGMHCVPEDASLEEAKGQEAGLFVEVGDEIDVLERGLHLWGSTWNEY